MCMAVNEHIAIKLSLNGRQRLKVAPGCHLMPVYDTDFDVADCHNLGLGEVRKVVEFSLDGMHLRLG